MAARAPEEFVAKVRAAIISWDPTIAPDADETAVKKAAYYIYFGSGHVDQMHNITDGYVYSIYDVIKFTASYNDAADPSCTHQLYDINRSGVFCVDLLCENFYGRHNY
jgi:hypothetical protein